MGDYAITKIILKVKKDFQRNLKDFIEIEKNLDYYKDFSSYQDFWASLGVHPFYYENYVFGSGSYHAYTTALGTSDIHKGSDFYINDNYTTRFEDGFWFVEFSSKLKDHSEFANRIVPIIADAWIGLYGDEYIKHPEKISHKKELIFSSNPTTQIVIDNFLEQYNEEPIEVEEDGWPFRSY